MRFENECQRYGSILVTVVVLISASIVLFGGAYSFAQETSGQVDYSTELLPAKIALARSEADGHRPSEAQQTLDDRLPIEDDKANQADIAEIVPLAPLPYDPPGREDGDLYKQPSIEVQESGLNRVLYTLHVVEVPTAAAKAITEEWDLVGRSIRTTRNEISGKLGKGAVVPASFTPSSTTSETRISNALSDEQISQLVESGKVISSSKIVGESGAGINFRVGCDVQFLQSYERVTDENGNGSDTMQPIVGTIPDGIKLQLTGAFDERKENVRLEIEFTDTEFKGMGNPYTYEFTDPPLTVQQPDFTAIGCQTSRNAPVDKTIALSSGPSIREAVAERGVPLVGRVPYVGKLFKKTAKATESITTIVLIRCQEDNATRL